MIFAENFNSHAHVERDGDENAVKQLEKDFNSHAHVERDSFIWSAITVIAISTHTLTWSVTLYTANTMAVR